MAYPLSAATVLAVGGSGLLGGALASHLNAALDCAHGGFPAPDGRGEVRPQRRVTIGDDGTPHLRFGSPGAGKTRQDALNASLHGGARSTASRICVRT